MRLPLTHRPALVRPTGYDSQEVVIGELRPTERISYATQEEGAAAKRVDVVIVLEDSEGEHQEYTIKRNVRIRWGIGFWTQYGVGRHHGGWWKPHVELANAFNFDQSASERERDKLLYDAWEHPYDVRLVTPEGRLYCSARLDGDLRGLKKNASETVRIYS